MRFSDLKRIFSDQPWFDFEMVRTISGEQPDCLRTELYRWRKAGKLTELRRGFFTFHRPLPPEGGGVSGSAAAGGMVGSAVAGSGVAGDGVAGSGTAGGVAGAGIGGGAAACDFGAVLAAPLYSPSYLSGRWALRFCGAMGAQAPEPEQEYTSVTSRPAAVFENGFGIYRYETLPAELHFGTYEAIIAGHPVRIARPEKAFLDACFVEGGEWDKTRIAGLGLDPAWLNPNPLDASHLESCRFDFALLTELARKTRRPRLIRAAKTLCALAKDTHHRELRADSSFPERTIDAIKLDCIATILRSLHESQALAIVAAPVARLTRLDANALCVIITLDDFIELCDINAHGFNFQLLAKDGYKPESWLFAIRRKCKFNGLRARIAFARRGDVHSGWIKFASTQDAAKTASHATAKTAAHATAQATTPAAAPETAFEFRLTIQTRLDFMPASSHTPIPLVVTHGSERFAIKVFLAR